MRVYAYNSFGYEGGLVRVEVDIRRGLPLIDIVGLAGTAVKEAKERIRVALRLSGLDLPNGHILVNLAPAGMPKNGASFDLPIAYAILAKAGLIPECTATILVMGELTLEGDIAKVDSVLPALIEAKSIGIEDAVLPKENQVEAILLELKNMAFVENLRQATMAPSAMPSFDSTRIPTQSRQTSNLGSLFDTKVCLDYPLLGLTLLCAAAGRHHMLMYGPPGSGKTMALRYLSELMPPLSESEILEVNRLYSAAGLLSHESGIVTRPPVRMPHHSASAEALVGGGRTCRPGEISLAHRGVLILDEAPEFKPSNLQALREPLEDGRIRISRADYQTWFPARFTLGIGLNSCPCGRLGSARGICICSPQEVRRYWNRIGGPLLDRIDLRIAMGEASSQRRHASESGLAGDFLDSLNLSLANWDTRASALVASAKQIQGIRYRERNYSENAWVRGNDSMAAVRENDDLAHNLRDDTQFEYSSPRHLHAILRVARTLADIEGTTQVGINHVKLARGLRQAIVPLPGFEIQD